MKRDSVIAHVSQTCAPFGQDESGVWYESFIDFDKTCLIPFEDDGSDDFCMTTYCHIFYQLGVEPPVEYFDEFELYKEWREQKVAAL